MEWATSCPPPRHNFTSIPRIRSERPAFDLHYPHIRTGRDRELENDRQSVGADQLTSRPVVPWAALLAAGG
jgi:heme/copper-type cytochrome/quinol oxidase subunit 1